MISPDIVLMSLVCVIIALFFSKNDITKFFVYIFLLIVVITLSLLLDTGLILEQISPLPFLRIIISAFFYMVIFSSIIYILKE